MEEGRGCLPPLPRQAPGTGSRGRRPLPPRLPRGDLVARAHSPSAPASPLPGPARLAAVYTRGPAAPPRSSLPPRPPGSAPRPRQRGPDTGRWTSRRKVSPRKEEGRGGAGRGEAGRKRAGRGRGERERRGGGKQGLRGLCTPTGNRWGGRLQGPAPRLLITIIVMRMNCCPGARQRTKPFIVFFHLILTTL